MRYVLFFWWTWNSPVTAQHEKQAHLPHGRLGKVQRTLHFGKIEVFNHSFPCRVRISFLHSVENGGMVAEQDAVVFLRQINGAPDALLELLHGIENVLHEV